MDQSGVVGGIIGFASAALILVVKSLLEGLQEERRFTRETSKDDRRRRIETDRRIYLERITILIRCHLAAHIRSDKWWSTRPDLDRLLTSLSRGGFEHFVDIHVNELWVRLVTMTVELSHKRLDGDITREDIGRYNETIRVWKNAASRSFGPLPPTPELRPREYPMFGERSKTAA